MSTRATPPITLPGAPPKPLPGSVVVDLSARRRERHNRDIWLTLDPDEPPYHCIPLISRGHRERMFAGFFPTDSLLLRSLIAPEDRARFDVLIGADLEWKADEDLPLLTSDGRPLLDSDTVDEALQAALINFGVSRQPDTSVVATRIRDLLRQEDVPVATITRAVAAAVAIINEDAEVVAGEVVIEAAEEKAPPVAETGG